MCVRVGICIVGLGKNVGGWGAVRTKEGCVL